MVKLIAIDLHMYKIFKITQVSFLRHSVFTAHGRAGILLGCEKNSSKIFATVFPQGVSKIAIFHQYLALSGKRY